LLVVFAEQLGQWQAEHIAQTAQGIEAGRHLGVFDLAQHALTDIGNLGHVRQFQVLGLALALDLQTQILLKLEARGGFGRHSHQILHTFRSVILVSH
jgi:hypothetical protein